MFRTLTLAAIAAVATSAAFAGNIDHLKEGNGADRKLAAYIETTGGNDVIFSSKSTAAPSVGHFAEGDGADRKLAAFIKDGVVSSKGAPSVAALEVALKSALEDDDRQLARFIEAQLGR